MKEFLKNQIAMSLLLFVIIVIGAYITMAGKAEGIITQVITATGSLVTGGVVGYGMGRRTTDKEAKDADK